MPGSGNSSGGGNGKLTSVLAWETREQRSLVGWVVCGGCCKELDTTGVTEHMCSPYLLGICHQHLSILLIYFLTWHKIIVIHMLTLHGDQNPSLGLLVTAAQARLIGEALGTAKRQSFASISVRQGLCLITKAILSPHCLACRGIQLRLVEEMNSLGDICEYRARGTLTQPKLMERSLQVVAESLSWVHPSVGLESGGRRRKRGHVLAWGPL